MQQTKGIKISSRPEFASAVRRVVENWSGSFAPGESHKRAIRANLPKVDPAELRAMPPEQLQRLQAYAAKHGIAMPEFG